MQTGTRWVEANGTVSRVAIDGTGPALVLIHEMGGTLESWAPIVPALTRRFQVIRYDVRGAGLSQKVRGTLSIETLARDLDALLDVLGAPRRVSVMGCAVGAAIAIQFAADFPERTAALIATSPATGVPEARRAAVLARADELERDGAADKMEERLARSFPPVLRHDPAAFEQVRASRAAADAFGMAAATRMLAELDMNAALARIACPALVLAGEHDGDRPPAGVQAVAAQIKNAVYRVLPTGHFMALQTPQLLLTEIEAFLSPERVA